MVREQTVGSLAFIGLLVWVLGGAPRAMAASAAPTAPAAAPTAPAVAPPQTTAGAALPAGWGLKIADHFGTNAGSNVTTMAQLHAKYFEGQFYNVDSHGLVRLPNVVINGEQGTYQHFEAVVVFGADHLTIQGRGHPDGTITTGELVSQYTARSFAVEAKYTIPAYDKSWPAFWTYACSSGNDSSELDIEQPITPNQGVHAMSLYNHPGQSNLVIADPKFTSTWMTYTNSAFDASTTAHTYTICYDDVAGKVTRFLDGNLIYTCDFKWNASLGGTGHGPDACTIFNLAVGGSWPGNLANPSAYVGDLNLYSIEYYGPIAPTVDSGPFNVTVTAGQTATFTVTAEGGAPLHYQWHHGTAPVGIDADSLSIPNAQAGDAGSYTVTVSNGVGTVTSGSATLTVNPAANPVTASVGAVNLSAAAGGTTPVTTTFTLTNGSGSSVTVTVSSGQSWLTTSAGSAVTVNPGATVTVTVTGNPTGLSGVVAGTLTVTTTPGGQTRSLPVNFSLASAPAGAAKAARAGGCAVDVGNAVGDGSGNAAMLLAWAVLLGGLRQIKRAKNRRTAF